MVYVVIMSVVVPFNDDAPHIEICIAAPRAQTYSRERYEILAVDNGSTDGTRDAIRRFAVLLLAEDRVIGSYAAWNRGLQQARGDVTALTDADCLSAAGWIEQGVHVREGQSAGLVGGRVRFPYSPR